MKIKHIAICASLTILIAGTFVWLRAKPDGASSNKADVTADRKKDNNAANNRSKISTIENRKVQPSQYDKKRDERRDTLQRLRQKYLEEEAQEIAKLSPAQKKLYNALQKAIDNTNDAEVLRIIADMQNSKDWHSNISPFIKHTALNALFAMGEKSLPEIIPFMLDSNGEIVEEANSLFIDCISDMDLSDYYRAELLIAASNAITDSDTLESLLFEINSMRNSVAIDTIKQLLTTGNSNVQKLLPETIETFVGEEGVETPEQLDEWLKQNPDDEFDDDLYGKKPQT